MAHIDSPVRTMVKPFLFKLFGEKGYFWFQLYGKLRDIKYRLVEEDEMKLLPDLIGSDDEVLDIGANYAYYTVRMADLCRNGCVYAFEPIPFTFKVCKKIVDLRKLHNVKVYNSGVGDINGNVEFEVPLSEFGGISAGQAHISGRNNDMPDKERLHNFKSHKIVKANIVRLDDFLPDLKKLTFIKIDIEGAEYLALQGMRRLLEKFKPAILIEVVPFFLKGFNIEEEEFVRLIYELGYEFYLYDKAAHSLSLAPPPLVERNYILLHGSRIDNYKQLIK
jgi:FkbM family methyltransferase